MKRFYLLLKIKLQLKKFGKIGKNFIWNGGILTYPQNIEIANNVYIGPQANLNALGGIEIGENTIIGPRIIIYSSNHNYKNSKYLPYDEKAILKKVIIEKNCWIGESVKIAPGVKIGEGSIIGIGSVVHTDIPKYSIAYGNPAKVIKIRSDLENYIKLDANIEKSYLENKMKGKIIKYNDKKNKILIFGVYGHGNVGDEAILQSMTYTFLKNFNSEIEVIGMERKYVEIFNRLKMYYPIPNTIKGCLFKIISGELLKTIKALKKCDIFIMGGGGFLSDAYSDVPFGYLKHAFIAKILERKQCFME